MSRVENYSKKELTALSLYSSARAEPLPFVHFKIARWSWEDGLQHEHDDKASYFKGLDMSYTSSNNKNHALGHNKLLPAKELMAQWRRPLVGRLPPRVPTPSATPKTSKVSRWGTSLKKLPPPPPNPSHHKAPMTARLSSTYWQSH